MGWRGRPVAEFVEEGGSIGDGLREHLVDIQESFSPFRSLGESFEGGEGKIGGLPVSVKDQICTLDFPTTAGSRILEDYRPPFDATVVERVREEGGMVVGKTNMDEFGFGTFCTNSGFEVPKNPHDPDRVVGGSSGGAGALTAAIDYPHIALAESTGGSITAPASFCGVVGLTPTYSRVSRHGLIDYANSLDKIGVMGKSVFAVAHGLDVIAGKDPRDFTTTGTEEEFAPGLESDMEGVKVGIPEQYIGFDGMNEGVRDNFDRSVEVLEEEGAEVEEVDMPMLSKENALPAYYIIAGAEASTNLARYCGMRYGAEGDVEGKSFNDYFTEIRTENLGEEAKRRVMLGTFARMAGYRSQYYEKALKVRTLVIEEFEHAFGEYDVLASPAMPIVAPTFEEAEDLSPVETYAMDTLTVGPNLAGVPHVSVPSGKVKGMPAGLHIMGDHFGERDVLQVANSYEIASGHEMEP